MLWLFFNLKEIRCCVKYRICKTQPLVLVFKDLLCYCTVPERLKVWQAFLWRWCCCCWKSIIHPSRKFVEKWIKFWSGKEISYDKILSTIKFHSKETQTCDKMVCDLDLWPSYMFLTHFTLSIVMVSSHFRFLQLMKELRTRQLFKPVHCIVWPVWVPRWPWRDSVWMTLHCWLFSYKHIYTWNLLS